MTETVTFNEAKKSWPRLLRSAAEGTPVYIVVDGKTVELHVVKKKPKTADEEYGVTSEELSRFERSIHGEIEKDRKAGKLHKFTGDIEALLDRKHNRQAKKAATKAAIKKNQVSRRSHERRPGRVGKPAFA